MKSGAERPSVGDDDDDEETEGDAEQGRRPRRRTGNDFDHGPAHANAHSG